MLEHGIKESIELNLSKIWNFSNIFSHKVLVSDMKKNFLPDFNKFLVKLIGSTQNSLDTSLQTQISSIVERSSVEKSFWLEKIEKIKTYSRKRAIDELIKSQRIYEKINQIDLFVHNIS